MPVPDRRARLLESPIFWILLASLLAITPLLIHGTACGHDLLFHVQNWMEVSEQWKHGMLRPFWCFSAAWGAGEPRFVFYPPFSWTTGALLGLLLPWAAVPAAYTWIALLLSGFTMHRLLRRFVPANTAILGTCLYLSNPYMLFVAFERSAEAELIAAAWMPLLLLAALRPRICPLRLALAVALLWLTNAPAAVVGSYALLLIGVTRLILETRTIGLRSSMRQAAGTAAGYALGLALSSFYLLPAIVQRRAVQIDMAVLPGMRPQDNFLFGHTGEPFHDAVLHTASWIAVIVISVALLSSGTLACQSLRTRRKPGGPFFRGSIAEGWDPRHDSVRTPNHAQQPRSRNLTTFALITLTLAVAFLLIPASQLIWRHAPELAFLQFPWRFLTIETGAAILLLTLALPSRWTARKVLPAALLLTTLAAFAAHTRFAQPCDEEDAAQAGSDQVLRDRGTEPTDEYTPKDADNDALHPPLPNAWLAETDDGTPPAQPAPELLTIADGNPGHLSFRIAALPAPRILVVRLRGFRGWHVTQDGQEFPAQPTRDDGLLSLPLTTGASHRIDIRYNWTGDEYAGLAVSAAALLLCLGLASRARKPAQPTV